LILSRAFWDEGFVRELMLDTVLVGFSGAKGVATDDFGVVCELTGEKPCENKNCKYRSPDQWRATRNVVKSIRIEK
jgi:hypothetical protein